MIETNRELSRLTLLANFMRYGFDYKLIMPAVIFQMGNIQSGF